MTSLQDAWGDEDPVKPKVKAQAAGPLRQQHPGVTQPVLQHPQHNPHQPQLTQEQIHQQQIHQLHQQQLMQNPLANMQVNPNGTRTVALPPDVFTSMFGQQTKDEIFKRAMAETHVMPEQFTTPTTALNEPTHTDEADKDREVKLLNQINQMLGDTETFLIRKIADVQRTFAVQTQRSLQDLSGQLENQRPQQQQQQFNWVGVIAIILLVIFFITLFIVQQCYFTKTIRALKSLNSQRVVLDVLHPELTRL